MLLVHAGSSWVIDVLPTHPATSAGARRAFDFTPSYREGSCDETSVGAPWIVVDDGPREPTAAVTGLVVFRCVGGEVQGLVSTAFSIRAP